MLDSGGDFLVKSARPRRSGVVKPCTWWALVAYTWLRQQMQGLFL